MRFVRLNKLIFQTSFIALAGLLLLGFVCHYVLGETWLSFLVFLVVGVVLLFLIFREAVTQFILAQLRKVYDSKLFENEPFLKKESRELDFEMFLNKINRFAERKHEEINQLMDRDDFRREFIGDVSHELKTPLFTAQGYLLTAMDASIDDPELEGKYLDRAKMSLERLGSIVKDLDMIAKLETGSTLDQDRFNLIPCIQGVLDMLEFAAEKRNINISFDKTYDFPMMVIADKDRIEQVLINLIQNSISYGKMGGQTTVSIKTHSVYRLRVEVADDGVGISEENLPRLFERFFRVDKSRSREEGGSGLGLSIVKHILEAHDQECLVESKPGVGSTFSFTLNKAD